MKIKSEVEILNPEIRKKIIQEINQPENRARKLEALKRYEIYKDLTRKYVMESLERELEGATVDEMRNRTSNVSICKKIIDKKARVYKNGATRALVTDGDIPTSKEEEEQGRIDKMYDMLMADKNMKKGNRFLELHKNSAIQVLPLKNEDNEWYLKMRILLGHTYDVVEDSQDPEKALVYILSHFTERNEETNADIVEGGDGRNAPSRETGFRSGDNRDQLIADSEADQGANEKRYIFWSKSFHFTTNEAGQILDMKKDEEPIAEEITLEDDRIQNEIKRQTIVSLNKDQDGNYWAVGGEDLIDGSVLINVLLTDLYFIAKVQGMGIFYAIGPDVPKRVKAGPNQGISIDTKDQEGGITPTVGFASSNPPLDSHMRMIEQYIALLLSTNNLASNSVQGKLDATMAASGIQELIVGSEVTSAIEDEQQIFKDAEPEVFKIIRDWQNWMHSENINMRKDFEEIGMFSDESEIKPKFLPFEEFMTEERKLEIIKLRRELGLDTMIDSLMRDNQDLTKPMAEAKLAEILKEKLEKNRMFLGGKNADDSEELPGIERQTEEEEEEKEEEKEGDEE